MNYTELKQAIQDWLDDDEAVFVTHLDDFIRGAEERIYRAVQLQALSASVTGNLTSSSPYYTLPTDFWSPMEIMVTDAGEQHFLFPKEVSFIRAAYPSVTATGRPRYYALWDDAKLILGPTPDSNYAVELHYLAKPESIVDAVSGETWLGTNGEQALLMGCLVQAYLYRKGDEDIMKQYETLYEEAVSRLKTMAEGQNRTDAFKNPEQGIGGQ